MDIYEYSECNEKKRKILLCRIVWLSVAVESRDHNTNTTQERLQHIVNLFFRIMDVNNVGREEEVVAEELVAEELVLYTQRQATPETTDLVGDVEVLADIVNREPGLQVSLG
jgi:hypothetical protein